jgi:hypothetical protein
MDLASVQSDLVKVPSMPYTDIVRYLSGATPAFWARGLAYCTETVSRGAGGIGLAPEVCYFYLPLTDHDRAQHAVLKDVEEIWLAFDLGAVLNGGDE